MKLANAISKIVVSPTDANSSGNKIIKSCKGAEVLQGTWNSKVTKRNMKHENKATVKVAGFVYVIGLRGWNALKNFEFLSGKKHPEILSPAECIKSIQIDTPTSVAVSTVIVRG